MSYVGRTVDIISRVGGMCLLPDIHSETGMMAEHSILADKNTVEKARLDRIKLAAAAAAARYFE